ncbi:hypothetical protein TrST_g9857 [Triparma strigata]|uniref:Uncharacterized protein n=1 Tax=Triparma strigata TaxID=1606541 RepID=A0A9W7AHU5_9STRA|nr:hypothetical protein TrST_g9857 [Triparma strigata]
MSNNSSSLSQPPPSQNDNSEIDPAFLQQAMAKRQVYQQAAAADRLEIEEARSGMGIVNITQVITEHQQFVADELGQQQPPAVPTQNNPNEPAS